MLGYRSLAPVMSAPRTPVPPRQRPSHQQGAGVIRPALRRQRSVGFSGAQQGRLLTPVFPIRVGVVQGGGQSPGPALPSSAMRH